MINEVRTELYQFVAMQEKKLKRNDHKLHWSNCTSEFLFGRLLDEVAELHKAMLTGVPSDTKDECVDIANFAMMIADNLKR
jgi:NTP pyrophosphatase (non-canonical NTP hydrolase)